MKLEDQVASFELSKRLKELGLKQESAFYWFPFGHGEHRWQVTDKILDAEVIKGWRYHEKHNDDFEFFSAFTVAELGEMLPKKVANIDWWSVQTEFVQVNQKWLCALYNVDAGGDWKEPWLYADTEANARAKMLIYLIEQGIVKL